MRRYVVPIIVVGIVIAGVGMATYRWWLRNTAATFHVKPRLVLADGRDYFGTTWETDVFTWTLPVVNEDDEPITVEDIRLSCSCMKVIPNTFTLPPGGKLDLRVLIDLTAKKRATEDAAFALTPTVRRGSEPSVQMRWLLRGKVQTFLQLDHPLSFGRTSILSPALSVEVRATTALPVLEGFEVQSSHPAYAAKVTPEGASGRIHRILVSHAGPWGVGETELTITLHPRSNGQERLPDTVLPVSGQIAREVEALPPNTSVGAVQVGVTSAHRISFCSLTNTPFKVLDWMTSDDGLSVTRSESEFVIRQECRNAGVNVGRVSFRVVAADGEYTVPVEVSCLGVENQ